MVGIFFYSIIYMLSLTQRQLPSIAAVRSATFADVHYPCLDKAELNEKASTNKESSERYKSESEAAHSQIRSSQSSYRKD